MLDVHTQACLQKVDNISVREIYKHKSVIEIAEYNGIGVLLDEFVTAVLHPSRSRPCKLLQLVPKQFTIEQENLYTDIQSVVDFLADMSNLCAVDLFRRITGITIH